MLVNMLREFNNSSTRDDADLCIELMNILSDIMSKLPYLEKLYTALAARGVSEDFNLLSHKDLATLLKQARDEFLRQ